MNEHVTVIDEPTLQFSRGQDAADPHDGLALFGPFSAETPMHPRSPAYVVLGTKEGVDLFGRWATAMNYAVAIQETSKHRLWPPYPGFEVAFGSKWNVKPVWTYFIDQEKLRNQSHIRDPHERCFAVVDMFLEGFQQAKKLDCSVVAICVIPNEVWLNCRPESRVIAPIGRKRSLKEKRARAGGQLDILDKFDPRQYQLSPDFRRQLKARTMKYDIPLQILRESTLSLSDEFRFGQRRLTPISDRMWNIGTALYYKCGGKPWRLNSAREGVCYIGIAFRRGSDKRSACCAAQMFLDSGDGIVFLAEDQPGVSHLIYFFYLLFSCGYS